MRTHHHQHFWGLFMAPRKEWEAIGEERGHLTQFGLGRLVILAAVPAISFLIGITQVGWSLSGADFHKIAMSNAIPMAVVFYVLIIGCTLFMAYCTYWMEKTFGTETSFERCLLFVTYTATPMYMAGLVGLVPIVWLCMILLLCAVFYSLYLLYLGVPIFMHIPEGQGYVVSTSIIWVGLCTLVCFNVATVIIWSVVL